MRAVESHEVWWQLRAELSLPLLVSPDTKDQGEHTLQRISQNTKLIFLLAFSLLSSRTL